MLLEPAEVHFHWLHLPNQKSAGDKSSKHPFIRNSWQNLSEAARDFSK